MHCRAALATLQPKFRLFQQRCAAADDACDCLAIALVGCPDTQAGLALPAADFEAALDFIESQAALLPGSQFAAWDAADEADLGAALLAAAAAAAAADGDEAAAAGEAAAAAAAEPGGQAEAALYTFFQRQSLMAGHLLQQHPAPFVQRTAPWLRAQLGWDAADLAAAALLSGRMPELCQLDTGLAQSSLDWLLGQGLSQQQASQLLLAGLMRPDGDLLASAPEQLEERRQRVLQLATQWGVPTGLAAALWLTQGTHLDSMREEDTGRLVDVLRVRGWLGGWEGVGACLAEWRM